MATINFIQEETEFDNEIILQMKVDRLKCELEKRNLPKNGSKAELRERLLNHISSMDNDTDENADVVHRKNVQGNSSWII